MIFIPYKLDKTQPPTHHRKLSVFLDFQKTSLSITNKQIFSWGTKKVPTSYTLHIVTIVITRNYAKLHATNPIVSTCC